MSEVLFGGAKHAREDEGKQTEWEVSEGSSQTLLHFLRRFDVSSYLDTTACGGIVGESGVV
jgi:hypothetical protein